MIYLTSDIHGDCRTFEKMLHKIRFTKQDQMYILGDAVDKGKENLRLIALIREADNIGLIKGNHEYLCERYLEGIIGASFWDACGGLSTRKEVDVLPESEKEDLAGYLKSLPIYKNIIIEENRYFLTHSGLNADYIVSGEGDVVDIEASVQEAVDHDQEQYLFSNDIHYIPAAVRFDRQIFVGHYPSVLLPDWERSEIYRNRRYTDIDTGNERRRDGGRLACLCLEDGREYYV